MRPLEESVVEKRAQGRMSNSVAFQALEHEEIISGAERKAKT